MGRLSKIIAAIEPWYDWGKREVPRLDARCPYFSDESYGPVRFFEIQWFGLHLAIEIGRTPRKLTSAEVADNLSRLSRQQAEA